MRTISRMPGTQVTDRLEQHRRLTEQSPLAAGGDAEAMELDEDFLHALEYAMPRAAGGGWASIG